MFPRTFSQRARLYVIFQHGLSSLLRNFHISTRYTKIIRLRNRNIEEEEEESAADKLIS